MILKNFIDSQEIEKIQPSAGEARKRLDKAGKFFSFAKKAKNFGDAEMVYAPVYDAVRIACESLLLLNGFRAKKSGGRYHSLVWPAN
ncbi:hypothetical protein COV49_04220 [Candidatus Falkowbacteria bacterium CG11_big_fil_rev_8_21_14_0_20_39_10]|uniref:HEPN domain-containing protein n=1 Tax=Candidatus Falkowbacteria bacterium CG11_big_fil_rev_8_21_14_0_20_39_10 TaxID=1974570 RepID=A0A2M6K818_9BACT|nr:MAG: hypothetical protein COV49_04220 [Candidatus Falkowbacteria bacterium CG11_big_fil_rev_8_21_14_0_20_39_10]